MMAKEMGKTDKMRKLFADKQVSAEQMGDVAGGTDREVDSDIILLRMLLGPDAVCDYDLAGQWKVSLEDAWSKVGVKCKASTKSNVPNRYFINGKEVSQNEAHEYAAMYGETPSIHIGQF